MIYITIILVYGKLEFCTDIKKNNVVWTYSSDAENMSFLIEIGILMRAKLDVEHICSGPTAGHQVINWYF